MAPYLPTMPLLPCLPDPFEDRPAYDPAFIRYYACEVAALVLAGQPAHFTRACADFGGAELHLFLDAYYLSRAELKGQHA